MGWKKQASTSRDFDLPPAGNHPAVLVALVDIGTHENNFNGKVSHDRKVYLCWELTAEEGAPVIGRDFTFSLNTKALLRQFIARWRGKDLGDGEEFDISVLLGKQCLVTVEHQVKGDKTYAKVTGVGAVPKGMTVPKATHEQLLWSIDDENPADLQAKDWLPYLYGDPLYKWADDCEERKGKATSAPPKGDDPEPAPAGAGKEEIPW